MQRLSRLLPPTASCFAVEARRGIFADKVRAGNIIKDTGRYWRVISNGRSQKGQGAASFHLKLSDVLSGKTKEVTAPQGKDFPEARYERLKLLFSGFDDDDMACFVYPQHHQEAGKEVNITATSLPDVQQKFLSVGMPADVLHIMQDDEGDEPAEGAASGAGKDRDIYCEVIIPTSYVYTVEKLGIKGMYKMAHFVECDGQVSVSDNVQPGDKIKVIIRPDGTASFNGKV